MASCRPRRMTAAAALAQLQQQSDDESGDENSAGSLSSDEEHGHVESSEETSSSEEEMSVREGGDTRLDEEDELPALPGRDGTQWLPFERNRQSAGRSARRNIVKVPPGPSSFAKQQIEKPIDAFKLIIDTVMLTWIVRFTNAEALR